MRSERGIPSGIAACLLENENEMLSVLNSNDLNTKLAGTRLCKTFANQIAC